MFGSEGLQKLTLQFSTSLILATWLLSTQRRTIFGTPFTPPDITLRTCSPSPPSAP